MSEKIVTKAGVGLLIMKDSKILLGLRHEDPEKADSELSGEGTWTMPGGKIDHGDTTFSAAKRELLEETGMSAKNVKIICVNTDRSGDNQFVTVGLLAEDFDGEPKVMEPDEITEWRWFDMGDLPKNMFGPSSKVLKCFLEKQITLDQ